jgi:hypothetical protein
VGRDEGYCRKLREYECRLLQLDEMSGGVAATARGVRQYASTSMLGRVPTQHKSATEQAHVPAGVIYAMLQATSGYST